MTISLNGETADTCQAKTIAELIERYRLPPRSILVEHNGVALHRHEWELASLYRKAIVSNLSASLQGDKQAWLTPALRFSPRRAFRQFR